MTSGQRIIISTFGSFGDVHPYLAIALELKARGHTPVIATSELYREKTDALDLELHPIRPNNMPSYDQPEELAELVAGLMEPIGGTEKVMQLFLKDLRDVYDDLNEAVNGADLLLTHPLPLVGPLVAQKRKLQWVSSVLAPISLLSACDPPVPPQFPALYQLMKRSPAFTRFLLRMGRIQYDRLMKPVYRLRAELGLPRGKQPLYDGQHSPTLLLALFSSVLAKPQSDWPRQTVVTGFPFYDRRDFFAETESPPGLMQFLDSGPPPIIFTLGSSAFWVARDFYRDSIAAAQALGQRALLLIGHARNLPPESLPESIAVFEYAPFGEVLPRARVVVHQGGVGTTGQGMRAGRPVLIVPHAHDQFDNAARVVRLGCGRMLARPRYNAESATRELKALLANEDYAVKAEDVGAQVRAEDGAAAAADAIEGVLNARG